MFFLTTGFNVVLGVLVYNSIKEKSDIVVAAIILGVILVSAAICTAIDYLRRKIMIERPMNEIVDATQLMARGNFKIDLVPKHSYENFDEYDILKENLNKMANELSKSEVLKNDFIANVSHEIKTPLAVIQNYAKALKNPSLDSETKEKYISNLVEACQKLNGLITNILKLNKLENQKLLPEIKEFNLSELLANQVLQFESLIEKKEIDLVCEIEEDLFIKSEESYLEIIFNNLMSNAIKFSNPKGMIYVGLKKEKQNYHITFKDSGCGMDKETGKHIFDKFYQGDTSRSKEGNGLGLALVKRVIDIIGGSIHVTSRIGEGTEFIITIRGVEL